MTGNRKKPRPPEHVEEPRPQPLDSKAIEAATGAALIRRLLDVSLARLDAAMTLERARSIVYPETTCILRDCERLARRLREITGADAPAPHVPRDPQAGNDTPRPDAAASFWHDDE